MSSIQPHPNRLSSTIAKSYRAYGTICGIMSANVVTVISAFGSYIVLKTRFSTGFGSSPYKKLSPQYTPTKISSATHVRHFLSRKSAIAKNVSRDNSISTR